MAFALRGLMLLACAAALAAPQQSAQPSGLETAWDIATVFQGISAHAAKMLPALEKLNAQTWVAKGASETYLVQLESSKDQARTLVESAKVLAKHPEQLSGSIEIYFRVQGMETMLNSLAEAIRRYDTPAAAQAWVGPAAENGDNRDRLQRYILNLAVDREQDRKVMDREAQRCRGLLTEPPPKSGRKK